MYSWLIVGKVECQDGAGPAINLRGSTGIYAYSTPYTSNGRTVQYPTLGFFGAQAINTVVSPIANSFYVWQEGNNFRTFTDVNTFPDIPVARVHMSSSIDKSKPQLNNPEEGLSYVPIYLFGGYGQSGPNVTFYNEMYLSTQNGNDYITGWELVAPSASSPVPEPRADHRVVSINDTMYLFGGRDDEGVFGDTWSYSYTNSTWKKLFDFGKVLFEDGDLEDNIQTPENASFPHSPPARYGHSMIDISDSDSNIVGGLTKLIVMVGGTNGNHTFNDLWGFDPKSQNWSQIVLPIAYPARHGSAFIRGPDSGTDLYLYGGELTNGTDPTVYYNDIFYLDLSGPQGPTPSFKRTPNAIIAGVAGGILLVLIIMVIVLKCTDRNSS